MKQFFYLGFWFFKVKFLRKKIPLQTVLFINDECNLSCKHCSVYNHTNPHRKTYEEIKEELLYSYNLGSRFVDFEGGEPLLWENNEYRINDLIALAKKIGFFSVTVTTNGQLPFSHLIADSIWVSIDGLQQYHDEIRGKGVFDRACKNIAESNYQNLNINMVINSKNYHSVNDTIRFAKDNPHIKAISLNFYTPHSGKDDPLLLDWEQRKKVIDDIILMKKNAYPIINSIAGLKKMKNNNFKKHCWISNFILPDKSRINGCPLAASPICDYCGYCMAGEMASVFQLQPETIFSALKLRIKSIRKK